MAAAQPAPHPFDEQIKALLRDPSVIAHLDALDERRRQGTLETHSDAEVGGRLRARGVPLRDEADQRA